MNTEDLFKTMCTISNAHANLIRGAQVVWANDDEDSFITAERKQELSQSDPGDQRLAEACNCAAATKAPSPMSRCTHPSWERIPGGWDKCLICGAIGAELRYLRVYGCGCQPGTCENRVARDQCRQAQEIQEGGHQ